MAKEIKEEKSLILVRKPPGDRWVFAGDSDSPVFPTLTDALEAWYQENGDTKFYMDARRGEVEIVEETEIEKVVKRFSLYGEE